MSGLGHGNGPDTACRAAGCATIVPFGECTSIPEPKSAYVITERTLPLSVTPLAALRREEEIVACPSATMRDESYMSMPGPAAVQYSFFALPWSSGHVECNVSHGLPCLGPCRHIAPRVLGDTSPRAVAANAATNGPAPTRAVSDVGPVPGAVYILISGRGRRGGGWCRVGVGRTVLFTFDEVRGVTFVVSRKEKVSVVE